jgi:hypothetical protein
MNEVIEAFVALTEYSRIQERLCAALFERHGFGEDRFLANIPKSGLLTLDGEVWQFKKHGLGVLFEQLSNHLIFDVHRKIQGCPRCFDTWRLVSYFESKNVRSLNVGSRIFSAQDELSLTEMLEELVDSGVVILHGEDQLFALAQKECR